MMRTAWTTSFQNRPNRNFPSGLPREHQTKTNSISATCGYKKSLYEERLSISKARHHRLMTFRTKLPSAEVIFTIYTPDGWAEISNLSDTNIPIELKTFTFRSVRLFADRCNCPVVGFG